MRGVAVDESHSTGAHCFHLRDAGKESWVRLDRVQVAPSREVVGWSMFPPNGSR